jgi:hypothetical protein
MNLLSISFSIASYQFLYLLTKCSPQRIVLMLSLSLVFELDGPEIESRWGARFSAPVQTGPGAYPASYTMGTGSVPVVKRPWSGVDHRPPSKRRGRKRLGLYLYSPSGPQWPVIERTFTFTYSLQIKILRTLYKLSKWIARLIYAFCQYRSTWVSATSSNKDFIRSLQYYIWVIFSAGLKLRTVNNRKINRAPLLAVWDTYCPVNMYFGAIYIITSWKRWSHNDPMCLFLLYF